MYNPQNLDFLDILTIFNAGLQLQGYINAATKQDIMVLNQKLDRLLQLVEGNSTDADTHPSNAP